MLSFGLRRGVLLLFWFNFQCWNNFDVYFVGCIDFFLENVVFSVLISNNVLFDNGVYVFGELLGIGTT